MKKPWKSSPSVGSGNARPETSPHTIRGRISGPVPIPSSMDDEFPIRNPGSNIATPVHGDFKEPKPEPVLPGRDQSSTAPVAPSPLNDVVHPQSVNMSAVQPVSSSPVMAIRGSPIRRMNQSNPARQSIASADTVQIRDKDRPHRKQSKLRGALGKLLGRKRKTDPNDSPNNTDSDASPAPTTRHNHHRSLISKNPPPQKDLSTDNRPDTRARNRPFPGAESKRSASLPITEFDRALRSHSVRPEDVRAIESARNSLSADFGLFQRQTGPRRSRETDLTGLSPRPASSQGRDSRMAQHDEDPAEIGRAITSDFTGSRRRSRSLSGLPEVEEDQAKPRRRSDEIRYWRESYDPAFKSPVSSDAPEAEDFAAVRTEKTGTTDNIPPQTPPEPFQFDTFATMQHVSGMKITHAAHLETRVCNLEARVYQLEQVLSQIRNDPKPEAGTPYRPAPVIPVDETPFGYNAARPPNSSPEQARQNGARDSGRSGHKPDLSDISFDAPPRLLGTFRDSHTRPSLETSDRPTSTITVRAVSSLPSLSRDSAGPLTMDHYATLLALVRTERSAREALESQVKRLGYQVSVMAKSALRRDTQYDPPPTAKSFGDRSAFDYDDEENRTDLSLVMDAHARSIDPEDSGIGTGHGDESVYSETFETPREEAHSFGAFGENLEDEDQIQKKSARTLSLSQLTLGKKSQAAQHPPHAI
ncbi:hypothetical protein AK830_g11485 [Neonectria ditissima]|uniref:Uncharacterized protein n=1 Tax=Neonectria ditissima TaxID=78410 RepID=A0A0P7ACQ4_9HYPO|nr:hypothetical protein AK830_g11485 [Neonectria ditissima]